MIEAKYKKAPISELVFGLIFNAPVLQNNSIIFELLSELKIEYPKLTTQPSIFEEIFQSNEVINNLNYHNSGFSLYRLLNEDENYMILIQQNFILLHWIRKDDIIVGEYPGFSAVYEKFEKLLSSFTKLFNNYLPKNNIDKSIGTFLLNYIDRVDYKTEKSINDILDFKIPPFIFNDEDSSMNCKFGRTINDLGYSIVDINTQVDSFGTKILNVANKIKGKAEFENRKHWFENANKEQNTFFESFFTETIRQKWKQ